MQGCYGSGYGGIILDPNGQPQCCPQLSEKQKTAFLKLLKKAWDDTDYRKKLLTFSEGEATDWEWYDANARIKMLEDTRDALEDQAPGIVPPYLTPVVLSERQFKRGVYWMKEWNERVFQLPDAPEPTLIKNVKFQEYAIESHICGM